MHNSTLGENQTEHIITNMGLTISNVYVQPHFSVCVCVCVFTTTQIVLFQPLCASPQTAE